MNGVAIGIGVRVSIGSLTIGIGVGKAIGATDRFRRRAGEGGEDDPPTT